MEQTLTESRSEGTSDTAVRERYTAAAQAAEASLCCPVQYDTELLNILPDEILERDYGCGDPSRYVQSGDTVVDLGSGGGKTCYIAAQIVGETGRVIGVDCNDGMLDLARRHQAQIVETLGYDNVRFRKGRIQDLKLDLEQLDEHLADRPVADSTGWLQLGEAADELRSTSPLIADDSIDVVLSNCVLNLVKQDDRRQLFAEIFRVLKRGGRAVISDIVSDEDVPDHLRNDPELFSGCISGSFREDAFLTAFEDAGFYGIEIVDRQTEPWAVVEGIEFRSVTARAWKGKEGPCLDHRQAVVYRGPWKSVTDDDGHTLRRGERMAVCENTYRIYNSGPYADQVIPIPPAESVAPAQAAPFACDGATRSPQETKRGTGNGLNVLPGDNGECCGPSCC